MWDHFCYKENTKKCLKKSPIFKKQGSDMRVNGGDRESKREGKQI